MASTQITASLSFVALIFAAAAADARPPWADNIVWCQHHDGAWDAKIKDLSLNPINSDCILYLKEWPAVGAMNRRQVVSAAKEVAQAGDCNDIVIPGLPYGGTRKSVVAHMVRVCQCHNRDAANTIIANESKVCHALQGGCSFSPGSSNECQ